MESGVESGRCACLPAVFVVDDDEPVRDSTCALLEAHGINVTAYASANALLAENKFKDGDCLVLDNHMPGMSGLQLAETLCDRKRRLNIIMYTGLPDADLRFRARRAGVRAILEKPISGERLINAILAAGIVITE